MSRVRTSVRDITDDLVAVRRDMHRHPELSWREERTRDTLLARLTEMGLDDVRPIARTGATALVRGSRAGRTLLWRADIDALPIPEQPGLPFASTNEGVMHACGHDAHAAIGLGIARVMHAQRSRMAGNIRFLFQPAEEDEGGAEACIVDGVLSEPPVALALGLHVSADIPLGMLNVGAGPFFAAPTVFEVVITGRGGHAASPHQTVDAVVVASHAVVALQTVVSRSVPPHEPAVLTIGKVEAGLRDNIIAQTAVLQGTIRTYSDHARQLMLTRVDEVLDGVCRAFGAEYTFDHRTTCPPVVNDPEVTSFVRRQGEEFFGREAVVNIPSMGADDMAVFLRERPGCYFWIGARNERSGAAGRHHDPGFVIDEDVIPLGVEFGVRLLESSLP